MRGTLAFDMGCVARFKPGTSRAACRLLALCVCASVSCHLQDRRRSCRLSVWAILERTGNVYFINYVRFKSQIIPETKQPVQKSNKGSLLVAATTCQFRRPWLPSLTRPSSASQDQLFSHPKTQDRQPPGVPLVSPPCSSCIPSCVLRARGNSSPDQLRNRCASSWQVGRFPGGRQLGMPYNGGLGLFGLSPPGHHVPVFPYRPGTASQRALRSGEGAVIRSGVSGREKLEPPCSPIK